MSTSIYTISSFSFASIFSCISFTHGIILIFACFVLGLLIVMIFEMPMPGVRCPACAARGVEQWVLPGKNCPKCAHAC